PFKLFLGAYMPEWQRYQTPIGLDRPPDFGCISSGLCIHCFENEIRDYIRETLSENEGIDWWSKLPQKIRTHAESRQETALKDSWLEGEKSDLLGFIDFGMLSSIMIEKWQFFSNIIPSQHWLKQRMEELEKARHFIAHNRMLLPSEFQRIYMYIADWNRV
ncbi:Swt1 family HEPN domain-containing protein, partial [Leadbetterella byssophila]|uniref:Swt1 family HEPN domain-containing protein n=1 Tax=Leadbetterella byssophila TaxID=316068 RepID=UPI0039A105EA